MWRQCPNVVDTNCNKASSPQTSEKKNQAYGEWSELNSKKVKEFGQTISSK